MKKKYLSLPAFFLLLFISFASAQNLVPNCSFEQHDTCPDNEGQIQRSIGWLHTYGDADYYNACSSSPWTVPPQINYQLAATGNAFAGGILFSELIGSIEVIHTVLSSPLAIGTTYYVSFKVNLCYNPSAFMNEAIDKIGAKFTTGTPPFITNSAHVFSNTIITDSINWTTISGSFVADSAYTHMYLGIFFDTANVNSVILTPALINRAYYFIDDVCVSDNIAEICNLVGIEEVSGENGFSLYPNPVTNECTIYGLRSTISKIEIYNSIGEKVFQTHPTSDIGRLTISIADFPSGIYFVTITDEKNNKISKKFVKL